MVTQPELQCKDNGKRRVCKTHWNGIEFAQRGSFEKIWKIWKKLLTTRWRRGNIIRSLARAAAGLGSLVITEQVPRRMKELQKSLKKLEKSSWQRENDVVISISCAERRAPCKLNNVMNKRSTRFWIRCQDRASAWSGTTLNFFEAMINSFNKMIGAVERSF